MKKFPFLSLLLVLVGAVFVGWLAPHLVQAAPLAANEMFGGNASNFASTAGLVEGNLITMVANIIRMILGFLGVLTVAIIIYAGYLWTTAGGEATKIEKAKKILKNAVIGLVIIVSSFAIAQFVLSALTEAAGGGTTTTSDGSGGGDVPPDSTHYFYLSDTNISECAESIQNLQLQFSFSQKVDLADVEGGISVTKSGEEVEGVFAAVDGSTDSARSFTFTPSQTCTASDGSTVYCFEADMAYEVDVSSSLTSSSGYSIQCSTSYPCSFDFVTGTGFDLAAPSLFEITSPDDGDSVYSGETAVLQAHAVDDVGVSSVSFYLDGDLLETVGVGVLADYFDGEWDTAGYVTNEDYDISAEGADCAGNSADDEISVTLRAASCDNGDLDEGEDEIDCGGDSSSDSYCGACGGDSCTTDEECSSGVCTDGVCVADVEIDEVSPGDGAAGNLITISGEGFGETAGSVVLLGDTTSESDDVSHAAFTSAECSSSWSDDQVIIQINSAAVSGPIKIITADGDYDRTDDDNGPSISDFEVNETVRPGLCSLTPSSGEPGDSVTVGGVNFDDSRGDSTLYFDSYEATSYENWENVSFEAATPLLDDGVFDTQLFVGSGDEREGSNTLDFTVSSTTSDEPPVISQIDPEEGPSGQYVTIYGSNFGTSEGTVWFRNQSNGNEGLGDTDFPDECEGVFWSDDEIIIKVSSEYYGGSDALDAVTHDLFVKRATDGEVSDVVDFEVTTGEAAPGVCLIDPDSGPAGTSVTFYGENFGADTGTVEFYNGIETDTPTSWDEGMASVVVPEGAETGPAYLLRHTDHLESNPVNFQLGVCDEDFSCEAGETCCSNGACDTTCPVVDATSHYAYYFSTGDIPEAPEILTQCNAAAISPTPWERWEGGTDVCLNAVLGIDFSETMNTSTFLSSGFLVEKCSDDDCSSTEDVAMSLTYESVSSIGFTWLPASDWEAGARYRVTVYGGDDGIFTSEDDLTMLDDAEWEFVTSAEGDECELGGVIVSPGEYTAETKDVPVNYSAGAVSDRYECEELACGNYGWSFSSSDSAKAEVGTVTSCGVPVMPLAETDSPVLITAIPAGYSLSDYGLLTIAFTDPKIEDYWPDCDAACLNAEIGATFNIAMSETDLEARRAVILYSCQDAGCTPDELTEVRHLTVDYDEDTFTLTIIPSDDLSADTPYRVVISGEVESSSGSPLSTAAGDLAWEGDVSWTFATKEETCLVDRVEVEPAEATVNYVGAVQRFTAVPYGSPDNCSAVGQPLTATDFDWLPWTSSDEEVAYLFDSGEIQISYELPEGCSASCLNEGSSTPTAVCGNGDIEDGEDCDGTSGCSSSCLNEGSSATCGNNTLDDGEECDDGGISDGDGCSSICLNEGADSPNSICGNGDIEHSTTYGGEDCDGEEGCSSDCLNTGSEAAGVATCGNGDLEPGEDCDGDADCSSTCLHIGNTTSACGNNVSTDAGEDCDDGNQISGDGCSSVCLLEGSGESYDSPSVCGNGGDLETGEECEVESSVTLYNTASFALAVILDTAPSVVAESDDNTASSTIIGTESFSDESGEGVLTLECSCEADGNCDVAGESYGCGQAGCCFERPNFVASEPVNETGVCRNTAVWMEFDQEMDAAAIQEAGTISLEYVSDTCPEGYNEVTTAYSGHNIFVRLWRWLSNGVFSILGANAETSDGCYVAATLESVGNKIYLNFSQTLEAGGTYVLKADGEDEGDPTDNAVEGAVSANGVGLYNAESVTFTVGNEICSLDIVDVEDEGNVEAADNEFIEASPGLFTASGEVHNLTAAAYHLDGASREEIQSTTSYGWTWSWSSTDSDSDTDTNIITVTDIAAQETTAEAAGLEGEEIGTATAHITDTTGESETTSTVTGSENLEAILCENVWPSTGVFEDTDDAASTFGLSSPYSNFSFYYCRDSEEGELLPELTVVETPVTPATPTEVEIFKEILFLVNGTSDAIGVRVLPNEEYYSPMAWYEAEGFTGSPSETTVDGYEAIVDGSTYYVSAANYTSSDETVYANIYVISFNEDAGEDAAAIIEQILSNWSFNVEENSRGDLEITDMNICRSGSEYVQVDNEYVSCESDKDCQDELSATYPSAFCDAEKGKLTRNLKRLTDARGIASTLADYGEDNMHCSVTKNQECTTDDSCPGDETCLPEVPDIQSGTFLSAFTTSAWPSWSAELGNTLGTALPVDPVNEFVDCPEGADEDYCWDSSTGTFECHEGSHAYIYQGSGGEEYTLSVQLELQSGDWYYDLDDDSDDNATLYAEYGNGDYLASGFLDTGRFCDGSPIGISTRCGDGVQGLSEDCEIGDVSTDSCSYDADGDGVDDTTGSINLACIDVSGVCDFQTSTEAETAGAECVPFECGNGVVDTASEVCDDGSMNGEYGYCGENCTLTGSWYCGDGSIAGGEECDCGDSADALDAGSWSSISGNCDVPNGQYTSNYEDSCAFDCSFPGTTCGDGEVNGAEECDNETDVWSGKLCGADDNYAPCSTDADCDETACGDVYDVCPISYVCEGGDYDSEACVSGTRTSCVDSDGGGTCNTAFEYQLSRYRTCNDDGALADCLWNGWGECLGGTQICGNGNVEGDEECDDGNDDDTDDCTGECLNNVCGDSYTHTDYETCDDGAENGVVCAPDYSGTCSYCNTSCQFSVVSGSYCGDGVTQSGEYCDGDDLPMYCFLNAVDPDIRNVYSEIDCSDFDSNSYTSGDDYCTHLYPSALGLTVTCDYVGACDGGSTVGASETYLYNGAPCASDGASAGQLCGTTDVGDCAVPVCQDDCGQTCPTDYDSSSILIQTELPGASKQTEADLYSYFSGSSPDTATLYLPACSVGTAITADIDTTNLIPPSIDIVFVTDLSNSMDFGIGTSEVAADGSRRIDYVVDSMLGAIEDLFNTYNGTSGQMRIATVSFSSGHSAAADTDGDDDIDEDDSCDIDGDGDGDEMSWVDVGFTDSEEDFSNATSGIESYLTRTFGGTPTAAGLECARRLLEDESTAQYKIVILLSDGDPTITLEGENPVTDTTVPLGEPVQDACLVVHGGGDYDPIEDLSGAVVYTAAITEDSDLIGYMTHFSSDICLDSSNSTNNPCDATQLHDAGRCSPNDFVEYAYAASSAEELEGMYETITGSILGVSVGMITDLNNVATETSGAVLAGDDTTLPFPDGFNCNSINEWTIPVHLNFNGTGTVNISDIKLSYCPSESAVAVTGTVTDLDSDDDGVDDSVDNCPDDYNPIPQTDADGDGIGAACDDDDAVSTTTTGVENECGDDEIESGEYCDGSDMLAYCVKFDDDPAERDIYGCGTSYNECDCEADYTATVADAVGICESGNSSGFDYKDAICAVTTSGPLSIVCGLDSDEISSDGNCVANECASDCSEDSMSDYLPVCGDGEISGTEICDTTTFEDIYCVKGANAPGSRDIDSTSCTDTASCSCASSDYHAVAAADLGICDSGTRRHFSGTYNYTDVLCIVGSSANSFSCGTNSWLWSTIAGTCVANACLDDCSDSSIEVQFFAEPSPEPSPTP